MKDAFHEYVVEGRVEAVNPARAGTKAAAHYELDDPGAEVRGRSTSSCARAEVPAGPT